MTLLLYTFVGLGLGSVLSVFSVAALVAVGLYILRLRRRQVVVPFLGLWEAFLLERKASALRSRLQRFLSLLLTLLLLLSLAFALGDPRPEQEEQKGRHFVVLMDVSASMKEVQGAKTRMQRAQEEVLLLLDKWGPSDRVLIVQMGQMARPLGSFAPPLDGWAEIVRELHPLDVDARLTDALKLASGALRGKLRGQILVVSDGALETDDLDQAGLPPVSFLGVADPESSEVGSVGITHFAGRRYPATLSRFEVLVEVENFSPDVPAAIELSIFAADDTGQKGALLSVKKLRLAPGERYSESHADLGQAEQGLIAEVARVDGIRERLGADDIARTLLAPLPKLRVLTVGEPNNFLEAALFSDDSLVLSRVSAADYPPAGAYDLTIFDGSFPPRDRKTGGALYLGAPRDAGETYPVALGEEMTHFGFDTWEKDSQVFRLLDPYSVQALSGRALIPDAADKVLAKSEGRPLLISGERPSGAFLALGFSPKDSDFVLRPVFPLFIANALEALYPRTLGTSVDGVRTGTPWRIPVGFENKGTLTLRGPLGTGVEQESVVTVQDGRALVFGDRAGFFELKGESGSVRFASSLLRTAEARLAPRAELTLEGGRKVSPPPAFTARAERPLWFWLVLVVFGVSFVEWWTYHRRITV